jgi:DNA-binding NarL/FixJ family response regulator
MALPPRTGKNPHSLKAGRRGGTVLNILVVEDEPLLADTLKRLIELNPRFRVTGLADDLASALAAAAADPPELALVDLQLANGSSGYGVAAKLHDLGIACLFTTARAPGFPVPDLAIGCLSKPFREEDLVRALSEAEDILRERHRIVLRPKLPEQLQLYTGQPAEAEPLSWLPPVRSRTSLWARLLRRVRRASSFRSAAEAALDSHA